MTILLRCKIIGVTVSIIEKEGEILLEPEHPKIQKYLEDEGILSEVLAGNEKFWQKEIPTD